MHACSSDFWNMFRLSSLLVLLYSWEKKTGQNWMKANFILLILLAWELFLRFVLIMMFGRYIFMCAFNKGFFFGCVCVCVVINYWLCQKLNLLGNGEFNHLIIILMFPLTCGSRLPLKKLGPTCEIFNFLNGE